MNLTNAMEAVAEKIAALPEKYDVHTVLFVLNGQHGEFDVRVEATDQDLEDHAWECIAFRSGGMSTWHKMPSARGASKRVQIS